MKYALILLLLPVFIASFKASKKTTPIPSATTVPADTAAYRWFVSLLESGEEIPHAMIETQTPIAKAFGHFRGIDIQESNTEVKKAILEHRDGKCVRLFVLILDKAQVLDIEWMSEQCT